MNFIYSIIFWAICFAGVSIPRFFTLSDDADTTFLVLQIIFAAVAFIFGVVAFFYNMDWRRAIIHKKNAIKRYERDKATDTTKYETLKAYYEKHLSENYPNMEKEIFGKIADSQPKELVALFQAYPELQTSKVLTDMMKNITNLVTAIHSNDDQISSIQEDVDNIKEDPWLLFKKGI